MIKFLTILGFMFGLFVSPVKAATEAFGIILGETTLEQLENKFSSLQKNSQHGDLISYSIDKDDLDYDKLKGPLQVFVEQQTGKVVVIYSVLEKGMKGFEETNAILARKYTKKKLVNPFVGNQYALYTHGSDFIELDAPHMNFEMTLVYLTRERYKIKQENDIADRKKKAEQEKSL